MLVKKTKQLTDKQQKVLDVVRSFVARGSAPSTTQLGKATKLHRSTARYYLLVLQKKGYVKLKRKKHRGIVVV